MNNVPKIVFIDLETTPLEAYSWGPKFDTNLVEFIEHTKILSYSAKELHGRHITRGWPDYKGYKKNSRSDEAITKDLWNILDSSDIVVAHNGDSFDIRVMNSRFSKYGLTPPSPYKTVDTRKVARRYLRLPSYSLDDLCDYFGLGRKIHHEGFVLWKDCMAGIPSAWNKMKQYNKQDVVLLEKIYLKMLPWAKHPNVGIYTDKIVCPNCGSGHIQSRGFSVGVTTTYGRFQCTDCGKWGRDTTNVRGAKPIVGI